jgi:hypothetical protein
MLQELALDSYRPEILRNQAWQVIGNIGTLPALEFLIQNLITTWGNNPPPHSADFAQPLPGVGGAAIGR